MELVLAAIHLEASPRAVPLGPAMLASALKRIAGFNQMSPMRDAEPATAHMMIVNPLRGGGIFSLFSTHPPLAKRVARLEAMTISMR